MNAKAQNWSFFGDDIVSQGEKNRKNRLMVFDWVKAAKLIKERQPVLVEAGLAGDWHYTGGIIFADGKPVKNSYTYLNSTWATPTLVIDDEEIACWSYDISCDPETKWPQEALDILNEIDGQ